MYCSVYKQQNFKFLTKLHKPIMLCISMNQHNILCFFSVLARYDDLLYKFHENEKVVSNRLMMAEFVLIIIYREALNYIYIL